MSKKEPILKIRTEYESGIKEPGTKNQENSIEIKTAIERNDFTRFT